MPKMTNQMQELWEVMSERHRDTFSLGWAMNMEELEDEMHFAYLVGSVPAKVIYAYFRIIEFDRRLRGCNYDESTFDLDIHLPA